VALGDFDRDGRLDVVAGSFNTPVGVLLNTTAFQAAGNAFSSASYPAGNDPRSVAVGDIDRDGDLDLVVGNLGGVNPGSIAIFRGDGHGGFGPRTDLEVGSRVRALALGDVDRDGNLDIVYSNGAPVTIGLLLGNGDGTFAPQPSLGGASASALAISDVNRDGKPDIVAGNVTWPDHETVSVFLGDGAGGFPSFTNYATGPGHPNDRTVAIGDLDNDGKPDIVTVNNYDNTLSVLLGDGAGGFGPNTVFTPGVNQPGAVALGDVNRDGKLDVAVPSSYGSHVAVLLGDGAGGFSSTATFGTGYGPYAVDLADVNRDGKLDIVTSNFFAGTMSVLHGDGAGGFAAALDFGGAGGLSLAIADLNRDGKPDVVTSGAQVLLNSANASAPDAAAGPDQSVSQADTVTLDGSGSIDPDGDPLVYEWRNGGTLLGTTAVINVNMPVGTHTLTLTVSDGTFTASDTMQLTVSNLSPVAVDDVATTQENTPVTIAVRANDSDPGSDPLTITDVTQGAHGAVVNNGGVDVTYTPAGGYFGPDSFTYTISDGLLTAVATVNVTVLAGPRTLSIANSSVLEGNAGPVSAGLSVTLSAATDVAVSVSWSAAGGNATPGTDYSGTSGVVTLEPGEVSKPLPLSAMGDTADEPNEAFVVTLSNPVNVTLAKTNAQGVILDDDGRPALCQPIAHAPFAISAPDSYCLVQNLTYSADLGAAIVIETDDVRLDLKGFTIDGSGAGADTLAYGIHALNRSDVRILNGTILGFLTGVFLDDDSGLGLNSSGHSVRGLRLAGNKRAGLWVEGKGSLVRDNLVVDTGGSTVFTDAWGIFQRGAGGRVLNNDVFIVSATGNAYGINLVSADGSIAERNRVGNATAASNQTAIAIASSNNVLVVQNRLHRMNAGIVFAGSIGKYQGNLTTGVGTPFSGGTNAGNNQ
jgi:hypothetical protein